MSDMETHRIMERYTIRWRGPFNRDEVIDDEGYNVVERLYAITHEPPTRKHRTLYIGRAIDQYIGQRLNKHSTDNKISEEYCGLYIFYYLGEVKLHEGQRRSRKRTEDIEAAIINYHGDVLEYNIQSSVFYNGRKLALTHEGNIPPGIEDFDTSNW